MNAPLLALAVLLSAAPAKKSAGKKPEAPAPAPAAVQEKKPEPFEGYLFYTAEASSPVPKGQGPARRGTGYVKLAVSPLGVRSETKFDNGGRFNSTTTLVTGNPPLVKGWSPQVQKFIPMPTPPQVTRTDVKSERVGTEVLQGLQTVHVRIQLGAETMDYWTAPGLVDSLQMDWIFATSSRLPPVVGDELKRQGAWGPVVRSVRGQSIVSLDRVERTKLSSAIFSESTAPAGQ